MEDIFVNVMDFFISDAWFWIFWITCAVSFLFRSMPPFTQIWNIYKFIFLTLFAVLFANYAKKSVKDWWNKD